MIDQSYFVLVNAGGSNPDITFFADNHIATPIITGKTCEHSSLVNFVHDSAKRLQISKFSGIAIAVAGIVTNEGDIWFSNNSKWNISVNELREVFEEVITINDFSAACYGIATLDDSSSTPLITPMNLPEHPACVSLGLGAGTGLGVAQLITLPNGSITARGKEAGHIYANLAALGISDKFSSSCSWEHILSGPGLSMLASVLYGIQLQPETISSNALNGDSDCMKVIELFCRALGLFAASVTACSAADAVYIFGGITQAFQEMNIFNNTAFREGFFIFNKDSLLYELSKTPVFWVSDPHIEIKGLEVMVTQDQR